MTSTGGGSGGASGDIGPLDLLSGLATTRAIRRYTDEPIPDDSFAEVAQILVRVYQMRRREAPGQDRG
jgi:hypothetical protein